MQLQYCDGCSTRIEMEKAVIDGDKTYCRDCATRLGLKRTTPSDSATRTVALTGSGARNPAVAGSGTRNPVVGGSGTRNPAVGGSGTRPAARPPSAVRRPISATPGRSTPGSNTQIQVPRKGMPHGDTTKVALAAVPAAPSPDEAAMAQEGGIPASQAKAARAIMVAGIVLGMIGLFLIIRGGKGRRPQKPPEGVKQETRSTETTAQRVTRNVAPPEHEKAIPTKDQTALAPLRYPGLGMLDNSFDAREEYAQHEVDKLIELDKSGKGNPFDRRKRWEAFAASSSGRTKAGQAAVAERLKALPDLKSRPPDTPANAQPGLEARIYEMDPDSDADAVLLKNLSVMGLRLRRTKVLPNVDIPDRKHLGALADGREERLIVRLSGYLEVPREGVYSLWCTSDDGSLVYVGNDVVVNNDDHHSVREAGGPMQYALQAGKHECRVDYFQGKAEATLILAWSGPEIPKQTIPASAFSH